MTSRCFNTSFMSDYQYHYSNVVDIGLNTERSIEEEYALPIEINYIEPKPTCVCPDLGEENMIRVAETAYNILKIETDLGAKMEMHSKQRRRE
jgi:hypothetical protein